MRYTCGTPSMRASTGPPSAHPMAHASAGNAAPLVGRAKAAKTGFAARRSVGFSWRTEKLVVQWVGRLSVVSVAELLKKLVYRPFFLRSYFKPDQHTPKVIAMRTVVEQGAIPLQVHFI